MPVLNIKSDITFESFWNDNFKKSQVLTDKLIAMVFAYPLLPRLAALTFECFCIDVPVHRPELHRGHFVFYPN